MEMPSSLKEFLSQEQWNRLRIDKLSPEDKEMILDIITGGFEGLDPEKIDADDVEETVELVEGLVDDLLEDVGEIDEDELVAAEQTSNVLLEDMAEE